MAFFRRSKSTPTHVATQPATPPAQQRHGQFPVDPQQVPEQKTNQ